MSYAISPHHMADEFTGAFDQKVEFFVDATKGWRLGVAKSMREKGVPECGFAQVAIVASYFEMIAKYRDGFTEWSKSEHYFNEGVKRVFPEIGKFPAQARKTLLTLLYDRVRCGLYHSGMTGKGVILSWDAPAAVGYDSEKDTAIINPDLLADRLLHDLSVYESELKDVNNTELRANFERRFDSDFGVKP